jgi:hypothetical protein
VQNTLVVIRAAAKRPRVDQLRPPIAQVAWWAAGSKRAPPSSMLFWSSYIWASELQSTPSFVSGFYSVCITLYKTTNQTKTTNIWNWFLEYSTFIPNYFWLLAFIQNRLIIIIQTIM